METFCRQAVRQPTVPTASCTAADCPDSQLGSATIQAPVGAGLSATIVYDEKWKASGLPQNLEITYADEKGANLGTAVITKSGKFRASMMHQGAVANVDFTIADEELAKFEYKADSGYTGNARVQDKEKNIYRLFNESLDAMSIETVEQKVKENQEIMKKFSALPAENKIYMDIYLKELVTDTVVQPKGSLTFVLAYPAGTDSSYTFHILHLKGGATLVELRENVEYEKKADGIHATVDSFSPFVIAWERLGTGGNQTPGAGGSQTPGTGGSTPPPDIPSATPVVQPSPVTNHVVQNTTVPTPIPVLTPSTQGTQPAATPSPSPKTGDSTPIALVASALVCCAGIFVFYGYRMKKGKGERV